MTAVSPEPSAALLRYPPFALLWSARVLANVGFHMRTPDEMRGRVSAVHSLFTGTSNQLGAFESGLTAALFGTVPSVLIGGIGTIAVAALWMVLFPQLRRLSTFEEP